MSKAILTYLKIYDKYSTQGAKKTAPIVKEQAYNFFRLVSKSEDPTYDFIKGLPERFKTKANEIFKTQDNGYTNEAYNMGIKGVIVDGKFLNFDNATDYLYGLGFSEPENAVGAIEGNIDNAQIISDEPLFVFITEKNILQSVKFINTPYTALGGILTTPLKTPDKAYAELVQHLKTTEPAQEEPIYYAETTVVGEYDKKDTESNIDDIYKILKINKLRKIYVKPEGKHYVIYDVDTQEELLKIKEDGSLYNGADIEVETFDFIDFEKLNNQGLPDTPLVTKYTIRAGVSGQYLTLSEIKAEPEVVTQIEEKLKELFGQDKPLDEIGISTPFHKITGTTVIEQPFSGMNELCIDNLTNSYKISEVANYLETFDNISHIYHYGSFYKINKVTKIRTADYTYLTKVDNTRDSNTEIVIYKGTPKNNQAFLLRDYTAPNLSDSIVGYQDIARIFLIFRNNAEFILDVTLTYAQYQNKTINDMFKEGATGILELITSNMRNTDIGDLTYSDSKLAQYMDGVAIHRPIKIMTDNIDSNKYTTSAINLDTRGNSIKQDVSFEIETVEIAAELPIKEIKLEDIEVTITPL